MSKKLAVGTRAVVLDVKAGEGAFFATLAEAREFAHAAIAVGAEFGRPVRAVITSMEQPLGHAIGNALEVREAAATLRGDGPGDLVDVCCALVGQLLDVAGMAGRAGGAERARAQLASGAAWPVFERWIRAQGGDSDAIERSGGMAGARDVVTVFATAAGYVQSVHARPLGRLAMAVGAGREHREDVIDPAAGILLHAKIGDRIEVGDPLAAVYANRSAPMSGGDSPNSIAWDGVVRRSFELSSEPVAVTSPVLDIMGAGMPAA